MRDGKEKSRTRKGPSPSIRPGPFAKPSRVTLTLPELSSAASAPKLSNHGCKGSRWLGGRPRAGGEIEPERGHRAGAQHRPGARRRVAVSSLDDWRLSCYSTLAQPPTVGISGRRWPGLAIAGATRPPRRARSPSPPRGPRPLRCRGTVSNRRLAGRLPHHRHRRACHDGNRLAPSELRHSPLPPGQIEGRGHDRRRR
jgi:hypothetical protein